MNLSTDNSPILPTAIRSAQSIPGVIVKSTINTLLQAITTRQNAPSINITNRFYDRMDTGGSFTLGDTSSYNLSLIHI